MKYIILWLALILFYRLCAAENKENIFSNIVSDSWNDWANWSDGHVPYFDENVILSSNTIVEIFNTSAIFLNNLKIKSGCVFTIYSQLYVNGSMTLSGSALIFNNLYATKILMNNGLLWLFNNANIYVDNPIFLGTNDMISNNLESFSHIYGSIINENGTIELLPNSSLAIDNLNHMINGTLSAHYNTFYSSIGSLIGSTINIMGPITLKCNFQKNISRECKTIIMAKKYLNVQNNEKIIDSCNNLEKYDFYRLYFRVCSK